MEKLRLTAKQVIDKTVLSKSTVYQWIKDGKFKTEDSPKGKLIIITQSEINEINELYKVENPEQSQTVYNDYSTVLESPKTIPDIPKISGNIDIMEILRTIQELSGKASKYELLEDKQNTLEKDKEQWMSEYFKLKYEVETLTKSNKELLNKIDYQNTEITQLKEQLNKKTFWKFFKG